eukprot:CCRYP_002860-RA/>CCRYP_002860-RA protein AED:0.36 eAED:1.00 QI:0/-1/0/1/-1/0/1/0/12
MIFGIFRTTDSH